jgi:hypothetical protein
VKQRLLLDRIDLRRDKAAPDACKELAVVIDTNPTGASAIWCDLAVMGAERAADKLIRERFII